MADDSKAEKLPSKPKARRAPSKKPKVSTGKGFILPQLLSETSNFGLAKVTDTDTHNQLVSFETKVAGIHQEVAVGHLWYLGPVSGDNVYACYRNASNGCDWVMVPNANVPKIKPKR